MYLPRSLVNSAKRRQTASAFSGRTSKATNAAVRVCNSCKHAGQLLVSQDPDGGRSTRRIAAAHLPVFSHTTTLGSFMFPSADMVEAGTLALATAQSRGISANRFPRHRCRSMILAELAS